MFVEVQLGDYFGEDDIVRYSDDYGRAPDAGTYADQPLGSRGYAWTSPSARPRRSCRAACSTSWTATSTRPSPVYRDQMAEPRAIRTSTRRSSRCSRPRPAPGAVEPLPPRTKTQWTDGLSNVDYAPLAEIMGRSPLASEACNCSAPDTGNMEILTMFGTPEQQEQWLQPLLEGEIRSCFAMTEPAVARSDATNIECRIERDGDEYVINGRKWWISGAASHRCRSPS